MFKLAGKIVDWVDEERIPLSKVAFPFGFDDYALIIEDEDGVIGRKFPINTVDNLKKSMGSFEKFASRLLPVHRRVAASYMKRMCDRYELQPTEKVAMYYDADIQSKTVSYKQAKIENEQQMLRKTASLVFSIDKGETALTDADFMVDHTFVKTAAHELAKNLQDYGHVKGKHDPLVRSVRDTLSGEKEVTAEDLHAVISQVYDICNIDINVTPYRDKYAYPKASLEKTASQDEVFEYISDHAAKLHGYFEPSFIRKLATDPRGTILETPSEVCKKILDILWE